MNGGRSKEGYGDGDEGGGGATATATKRTIAKAMMVVGAKESNVNGGKSDCDGIKCGRQQQ